MYGYRDKLHFEIAVKIKGDIRQIRRRNIRRGSKSQT